MRRFLILFLIVPVLLCTIPAQGHSDDSTSVTGFVQTLFGSNQPKIGLISSFDTEIKDNGTISLSTFNIHVLRFYLRGSVESRFSYVYQAELN
jgi:hypothetical protein